MAISKKSDRQPAKDAFTEGLDLLTKIVSKEEFKSLEEIQER